MLTDQSGQKSDAFIVKGYDKTQKKGVFIAQLFTPKEKGGTFKLIDKPMILDHPELPFPIDESISPNYTGEELYSSGMVLKNDDRVAILSHHNPSVVSRGIKNFLRTKLQGPESSAISGKLDISIAPQDTFGDFFKYTITRVINEELNSPYAKSWEQTNNKKIRIQCKHGDDLLFQNYYGEEKSEDHNKMASSTDKAPDEQDSLVEKYQSFGKAQLDKEFHRIASIPNARTNIDCLTQMAALMKVYESNGMQMPSPNSSSTAKPKSGCMSAILFILVMTAGYLITQASL